MGKLMALKKRYTSSFKEIVHCILLPVFPGRQEAQCQMRRPSPGTVDVTAAARVSLLLLHQGGCVSLFSWDRPKSTVPRQS